VQKGCNEESRNQIRWIIEKVYIDPSKEKEVLDEASGIEADSEEYEGDNGSECDEDIIASRILTNEALLKAEFGIEKEESKSSIEYNGSNTKLTSPKKENDLGEQAKIEKKYVEEIEMYKEEQVKMDKESYVTDYEKSETPVVEEKRPNQPRIPESRIPTAMKSRPKIPRTPIPEDKLIQIRKENAEFKKNAMHIYVKEEANLKKQKMLLEGIKGEERKNYAAHELVFLLIKSVEVEG